MNRDMSHLALTLLKGGAYPREVRVLFQYAPGAEQAVMERIIQRWLDQLIFDRNERLGLNER
jgi:hypothetical protein